jgi:hypothetical protein
LDCTSLPRPRLGKRPRRRCCGGRYGGIAMTDHNIGPARSFLNVNRGRQTAFRECAPQKSGTISLVFPLPSRPASWRLLASLGLYQEPRRRTRPKTPLQENDSLRSLEVLGSHSHSSQSPSSSAVNLAMVYKFAVDSTQPCACLHEFSPRSPSPRADIESATST